MAVKQKYGISYPFSSDNDENIYVDLNNTYTDNIKSQVLHVLFTPKGQRLRNPEFGTDLIKHLFEQNDESTASEIKNSIAEDIGKYVPNIKFNDISVHKDDESENGLIVIVQYTVNKNGINELNSVAVKI